MTILWCKSLNYLGVTLDSLLNFNLHISQKQVFYRIKQFYPIISSDRLYPKIGIFIYKYFLQPLLSFAYYPNPLTKKKKKLQM